MPFVHRIWAAHSFDFAVKAGLQSAGDLYTRGLSATLPLNLPEKFRVEYASAQMFGCR